MNSQQVRSALAQTALNIVPPLIRDTLLEKSDFREEYGLYTDSVLHFGDSGVSIQCSGFFEAVRKVLSGTPVKEVVAEDGAKWKIENISSDDEPPTLVISHGKQQITLPFFAAFSPDRNARLCSFDKRASEVGLPDRESGTWRKILSERALEDDEVDAFHSEFEETPVAKAREIRGSMERARGKISSLVPNSRKYFERLVGKYDGSSSVMEYASSSAKSLFEQLSVWNPFDGFLYSLFLSSHSSLTDQIPTERLHDEDLVRAFDFLGEHGDKISQLGAIEVGMRVLPSNAKIEQQLIRLIERNRDDDDGQASSFELLSALVCLVDGELSRTRLFSVEPPFYRRLAAWSHAALIHRQLVNLPVEIPQFSKWAIGKRGPQFYCQSLADMRLEPWWEPVLIGAPQLRDEFWGRIMIAGNKYEANIKDSAIYDLIFGEGDRSLHSLTNSPNPWFPGPLDGTEGTQRILPPEAAEAIETQLNEEEVGLSSFIALINSALIFRVEVDHAELAAKALKRGSYRLLNIEDKPQLVAILDGLSTVAARAKSRELADELRILVRKYRQDSEFSLTIQEILHICLVAAASRSDLNEWREFVGDWLTELAFGNLKDNEGRVLFSSLNGLCHVVPELWIFCSRADAALMAFNAR